MNFRWQLGVYDRQTGENFRMSDELGSAMRPVLSPDGRWLVYATRWDAQTGLRVRDLKSGDDSWLIYPVTRDDQESASTRDLMPGSSFTPDSKALITSFDGSIWRVDVPSGEATKIPFTAQRRAEVSARRCSSSTRSTRVPCARSRFDFRACRLTASSLAFTALDRLWIMDYPSGKPRRISTTDAGEHQPAWSPDGQFADLRHAGQTSKAATSIRVAADGGIPQKLTQISSFYSDPVYSPDGQRIVVVRGPRGGAAGGLLAAGPRRTGDGARVASGCGRRDDDDHAVPRQGAAALRERPGPHLRVGRQLAASSRSAGTAPTARRTSRSPATRIRTPNRPSNGQRRDDGPGRRARDRRGTASRLSDHRAGQGRRSADRRAREPGQRIGAGQEADDRRRRVPVVGRRTERS